MSLTLAEALTIEPLNRARLVAGESGITNVITSVNVMEVPDILKWVHKGQLLVTTLYPIHDKRAVIDSLLPSLHNKGLAGMAVKAQRYVDELSKVMISTANSLGFPLIELPSDISFIDIIRPITARLLELKTEELAHSEKIYRQFVNLMLEGGGFPEIARMIAHLTNRPVTITDSINRVLGYASPIPGEHPQDFFVVCDEAGDTWLGELYQADCIGHWDQPAADICQVKFNGRSLTHLVYPIHSRGLFLGNLLLWHANNIPSQPFDTISIEHGATITALKMIELRNASKIDQCLREEVFELLLSENSLVRMQAISKAQEQGLPIHRPYAVIVVAPDHPLDQLRSRRDQSKIEDSLFFAKRSIRLLNPDVFFWQQGTRLIAFYPLMEDSEIEISALEEGLKESCHRVRDSQGWDWTVSMGISGPHRCISGFRDAYLSARRSLEIGILLGTKPFGSVTRYEKLGIFRLISPLIDQSELKAFCTDTIGPILAYDEENGTELFDTLRVYFEHGQNSTQTAKALFIHYNTLRYRLTCINELLEGVLDNQQKRLALELAIQLYDYTS